METVTILTTANCMPFFVCLCAPEGQAAKTGRWRATAPCQKSILANNAGNLLSSIFLASYCSATLGRSLIISSVRLVWRWSRGILVDLALSCFFLYLVVLGHFCRIYMSWHKHLLHQVRQWDVGWPGFWRGKTPPFLHGLWRPGGMPTTPPEAFLPGTPPGPPPATPFTPPYPPPRTPPRYWLWHLAWNSTKTWQLNGKQLFLVWDHEGHPGIQSCSIRRLVQVTEGGGHSWV